MKEFSELTSKIIACFLLYLVPQYLYCQPSSKFDETIYSIYNQDFYGVPAKIEILKKTSPQIADYIEIDYLWWKMISVYSEQNELAFISKLNSLNNKTKNSSSQNYNRLMYFTYLMRFENMKDKKYSKYLALLKFHLFMKSMDTNAYESSNSFIACIFKLMNEVDEFMKFKFLNQAGFDTKKNSEKCKLCLQKIEFISNQEYKSFDVVKTYLLAKIYLEIENNKKEALVKFAKLSDLFPNNSIFKKAILDCKKESPL